MGVFGQSVAFLLFFMPVRVVAGGYHAESYGSCFILTNLIAGMNVIAAGILWHNRSWQTEALIMALVILSWIYICRRAPVTSERYPQKPERIAKNRRYAHAVIGIEAAAVAVMRAVFDTSLVYTAVIATCTVAVMIAITRKGGKRK